VYTTECHVAGIQCIWVTAGAACPGGQAREAEYPPKNREQSSRY